MGPDDEEDDDLSVEDQSGGPDVDDDDDYIDDRPDVEDEMDRNYPEYSKESRDAGRFLGVDFPYVPGDPFW